MNNKAVILGCNYYIGLSVIRSLGAKGIHTVATDYSDFEAYGAKSKYVSERLITPHYRKDTQAFVDFMVEYAKKQEVKPVLLPCHDSYVEVIDAHFDTFKEYFLFPQQEASLYTNLMDKRKLEGLALKHGVKIPEMVMIDDENFEEKVKTMIGFPCIIKPSDSPTFVSTFRHKSYKVNTMEELMEKVEMIRPSGLEVFIQRIIPGFDDHMYTYDSYIDQSGKTTHAVTCQKQRQYPINFGASVYTGPNYVDALYEEGRRFMEAVGYRGFSEIEFKKDANTGEYYLIEVNIRFTNFDTLLQAIGFDVPWITYMELSNKEIVPEMIDKHSTKMFHYGYEDLLAVKGYIQTKQLSVGQVLKSYFRPKAKAIWRWSDPMPGLTYTAMLIGKVFKR